MFDAKMFFSFSIFFFYSISVCQVLPRGVGNFWNFFFDGKSCRMNDGRFFFYELYLFSNFLNSRIDAYGFYLLFYGLMD